jgi:hypothetical protein
MSTLGYRAVPTVEVWLAAVIGASDRIVKSWQRWRKENKRRRTHVARHGFTGTRLKPSRAAGARDVWVPALRWSGPQYRRHRRTTGSATPEPVRVRVVAIGRARVAELRRPNPNRPTTRDQWSRRTRPDIAGSEFWKIPSTMPSDTEIFRIERGDFR